MRNRITYGQSAVFCSQSPAHSDNSSNVSGLRRVQDVSVDFSFARERFKQVGSDNFIGDVHLRNADISASLSYLYSNGLNEALIGLNVNGASEYITKYIKKQNQDRNIYIVFGSGENNNIYHETSILNNYDVCALGNCYLNSYSLSARIGAPISVKADFSAYNIKLEQYDDINGKFIPAINTESGIPSEHYKYTLSTGNYIDIGNLESETDVALAPNKIDFVFPTNIQEPGIKFSGEQTAPLQSFDLSFSIERRDLYGFGSLYPYGRRALFPLLCNLTFNSISQEFSFANLHNVISTGTEEYDFTFNFKNCDGATGLQIQVSQALIDSESFSQNIGSDGSVNVSMSFPVSNTAGLKMSTQPLILSQPIDSDATGPNLTIGVTGKTPFSYQWYNDAGIIQSGETGPSMAPASTDGYYCVVSNELGSGISRTANYTV